MESKRSDTINTFSGNEATHGSVSDGTNDNPVKPIFLSESVIKGKERVSYKPLDVIKILLRERAMKQVDLADNIGMSRQALNNYIRGEWTVPTQIKLRIAESLNVDSAVIWDLPK